MISRPHHMALALVLFLLAPAIDAAGFPLESPGAAFIHHELSVRIDPEHHGIEATDHIAFPDGFVRFEQPRLSFLLHDGLHVSVEGNAWRLEALADHGDWTRYGLHDEDSGASRVPLREYVLRPASTPVDGTESLTLTWNGTIDHPIVAESEEYARSFARSPGLIDPDGVVLSGSTWWLPTFGDGLMTFRLSINVPEDWDAVSQGSRIRHERSAGRRLVTWDSPEPMDEIYLIAARFVEYSRVVGPITAFAFLRESDPNLAAKYLEATAQYIDLYSRLIGPYPYGKFALVENSWETGYGMPSFTLLGSQIIRFPFILTSSYPHEILHNWWGNSVFVDWSTGNWCEGLTAYLADYLLKEGRGQGLDYRRDTLVKYRNFVRGGVDFPLTAFRSRHSSVTEAVGYGKTLMVWHMLRRRIGDEAFRQGLQRFYRSHRFSRASFADLETTFSAVTKTDLKTFFQQWVERSGAPQLQIDRTRTRIEPGPNGKDDLIIALRQIQGGAPYALEVPVAVSSPTLGEAALLRHVSISEKEGTLHVTVPAGPIRIDIDPEFDLFRRLDPLEIPPSIGQVFGAEHVLIVLPADDEEAGSDLTVADWRELASGWATGNEDSVAIAMAGSLDALPADRAVWILGQGNRWAHAMEPQLATYGAGLDPISIRFGSTIVPRTEHCFVFTVRHPLDSDLAVGWIGATRGDSLPGLARKLPHYGRYSWLAFRGSEPTNDAKGLWPSLGSPLSLTLGKEAVAPCALPPREPLARPTPAFDPARLAAHVTRLAASDMEGRGLGTAGHTLAGEWIADAFEKIGLIPAGDNGGWFQQWSLPDGPGGKAVTLRNIVGALPGTRDDWSKQSVVLGAHYDHLGYGWPDVRQSFAGQLHPGADDNASGVSVLIEIASVLARTTKPARSLVFVAFDGEEWGLRGSRHYTKRMHRWPARDAIAMVNLDSVGRLEGKPLTLLGTGTASEWLPIARGIGFTTGIQAKTIVDDPGGSDQVSFLSLGIPAIQVFSGANEDYHRPSDVAEKIDAEGMVKVATFVREALLYLCERDTPLHTTLSAGATGESSANSSSRTARRVSLGTLPEFSFPGPGVRIEDVLPDTPAARAGLLPGDLIVSIDGKVIADVKGYAAFLRSRDPGDTIHILLQRGDAELEIDATLVAR